eukprot:15351749-Alexandrium_andersonii.AAC.1
MILARLADVARSSARCRIHLLMLLTLTAPSSSSTFRAHALFTATQYLWRFPAGGHTVHRGAVSYTHLTLPTICSV